MGPESAEGPHTAGNGGGSVHPSKAQSQTFPPAGCSEGREVKMTGVLGCSPPLPSLVDGKGQGWEGEASSQLRMALALYAEGWGRRRRKLHLFLHHLLFEIRVESLGKVGMWEEAVSPLTCIVPC